ncbi:MAG TPA: phosphatidylserine decarboxylase [Candidatus Polarisedimenticolaceae bacterium]
MSLDRAAYPFAVPAMLLAVAAGAWNLWASIPFVAFLLFTLWFFRDPERTTPAAPGILTSPADGRILKDGPSRISVFMSPLNVHVCRAPAAGRIVSVRHERGRFLAAFKDEASEQNERATLRLATDRGEVAFTLVAGLIARRIVVRVEEGQVVSAGERIGLIRFGSRVDLDLPPGAAPAVAIGDRVTAGESVLARFEA